MKKYVNNIFSFLIIMSFFLVSCITEINKKTENKATETNNIVLIERISETPTIGGTFKQSSTQIPHSTPTYIGKWTQAPPSPTLSYDLQDGWYKALQDNRGCQLPCFLGISPGKTAWVDARQFLQKFDVSGYFNPYEYFKLPGILLYQSQIFTGKDIDLSLNMNMEVEKDLVQRMVIDANTSRDGVLVRDDHHLDWYSIKNVFLREGIPDQIIINPPYWGAGYSLGIVYLRKKFIISYNGAPIIDEKGNYFSLCPNLGDGNIDSFGIVLESPSDKTDIRKYGPIDMRGTDHLNYEDEQDYPINKVTDMDLNGFYNFIISHKKPCFMVKPN